MIRAFLALPLPDPLADLLVPVQAALRLPRPVPVQDFHVTLVFLDGQREDVLGELHHAIAALSLPAPSLALDGLDVFGDGKPQNLHAVIRPDPALDRLQARLAQATRGLGIALPRRRFRPHVTLGRGPVADAAQLARDLERLGAVAGPAVIAPTLTLYRSRLRPEGPLYDPLAEYPLNP